MLFWVRFLGSSIPPPPTRTNLLLALEEGPRWPEPDRRMADPRPTLPGTSQDRSVADAPRHDVSSLGLPGTAPERLGIGTRTFARWRPSRF